MSVWRPPQAIRVKVLGLLMEDRHLFAFDVLNDRGTLDGVRPLGGTIEFGENREAALRREFQEELGSGIDILGPFTCFENIYVHEGETGHEVLFVAPIRLVERSIPLNETVSFSEADGGICHARWWHIDRLRRGETELYPDGLLGHLAEI